ncbi:S9 family peptidase [Pedobacter foliorum]|uniref:S9 family peptidase n=1 Tax=Pedobacter foliorum TaxID=2739058 RepID=UPI001566ED0D|nr:S9 family peptidase [Pedobacter foliorum]NRF37469.1 prolyl oligopeptidase family serine peptidase [Pedobacter foliorum]
MKIITFCMLLCLGPLAGLKAQEKNPYQPETKDQMKAYQRIAFLDSTVSKNVYNMDIKPVWSKDNLSFWYSRSAKDGREVYRVDAITQKKTKILDDRVLLTAANGLGGAHFIPSDIVLTDSSFSEGFSSVRFMAKGKRYQLDLREHKLMEVQDNRKNSYRRNLKRGDTTIGISPNRKWLAYIKENNIYLKDQTNGKSVQLSTDGNSELAYGELTWAPNSEYLIGYKIKNIVAKHVYTVLSSVPNTSRGELVSRNYFQPGDENSSCEMYVFNTSPAHKVIKMNMPKIDFEGPPEIHFTADSKKFLFNRPDRTRQRFRIIQGDASNGTVEDIVDEKSNTFIFLWRVYTQFLPKSNEVIWSSEKDGYRHLYLVNSIHKTIKPITEGNWVVRGIDSVDAVKREIWFQASGMNKGEDPYNIHYYRISFSGKNLVDLTPEIGNHKLKYSPDFKYGVDSYSQVNVAPVHKLLRASDGKKLMNIEQSDITYLTKNKVQSMKPFVAKARDGLTDIYGVICFPSNIDSTKSYPIIENIYAGPHDSFVPKNFVSYGEMQSTADLGFVVVQIDGMGTANRSKAFHDLCWKNLVDAGLPDRMLWIKAMAKQYPYADTARVGIYGTSAGGQNSLGALLFHSDFYKAAVSSCGCHDNRIDKQPWNEQWMGYPVGKHYEEQSNVTHASNLKGRLMLIVGENDANVPPESTYRVADALIKSNKDFEFLAIPGAGHTDGGAYGRRKKRDFFIRYLLNVTPISWNSL